ncbi:MAG: hypothetical protein DMG05_05630 [Acidobacteria bacterium]|nr:MAG: hypothetical protein DMG05_05630 [Acidobacteriota bacterium]
MNYCLERMKSLHYRGNFRRPIRRPATILAVFGLVIGVSALLFSDRAPAVRFVDVLARAGITFKHDNAATPEKYFIETMGAGCGWIDYNNDGLLDAYFVQSAETRLYKLRDPLRSALYRNNGDGTFSDVTSEAGVGAEGLFGFGVAAGDYDNDGFMDLYVVGWDRSILYHNNGDGTFRDVTAQAGVANRGHWGSSAAFFDYDKDSRLDLMVANYVVWSPDNNLYCGEHRPGYRSYCHPDNHQGQLPTLYHNNGDGTFTEVTKQAGMAGELGKGLGLVAADFDNDGWTDVFQANDTMRNFLFMNNRDGTFRDAAIIMGVGYSKDGRAEAGMGTDAGDYDGDGWMDIYVTHLDHELDRLYHNNADGTFDDVTLESQIGNQPFLYSGFGMGFVDFDNDGALDIFVANGHILDNIELFQHEVTYAEPKLMFRNVGGGRFENVSSQLGSDFSRPRVSRGTALGDYDNDGDLDLLVSNNGQSPELLRNEGGNLNNWITLRLRGVQSNRDGIGARVKVVAGGLVRIMDAKGGTSYQSAHDPRIHFGLGTREKVDLVQIRWPSGKIDELKNVSVNQFLYIKEGGGLTGSRQSP